MLNVITKKPVEGSLLTLGEFDTKTVQNPSEPTYYQVKRTTYSDANGKFSFEMRTKASNRYYYRVCPIGSSSYSSADNYYLSNKKLSSFFYEAKNNNINSISKKSETKVILYALKLTSLETSLINKSPYNNSDSITVWASSDGYEDIINSHLGASSKYKGCRVKVATGTTVIHWEVFKNNIKSEYSDTLELKSREGNGYTIEY